jgi:glycosyltransferase involved in cell wall biosynthesis
MRIGIDARFLTHPQKGGFKTYSENLITALAEVDRDNSYFLYLDRAPNQETKIPHQPNFEYRVITGQNPVIGMPWREQIALPRWVAKDKLDLLHSPCLTAPLRLKCASIVTIHDMIWHSSGNRSMKGPASVKRKLMNWYYSFVPELAARNASFILTVSQASKDRITQLLGIPEEKIFVTYEAANPIFRQINHVDQICAIRKKYDLPSNFIMAIGSADPRKNIATLVHAYAQLPNNLQEDYKLIIVWTHSLLAEKLMMQVNNLGLNSYVHFITQVTNEDLVLLYNTASLFVFPSLDEGFGLPILEAMASGTPVVTANNSSIPEIAGDAAILTNAEDVSSIAKAVTNVLTDPALRRGLIEKGLVRANSFSWRRCGYLTTESYKNVLSVS